MDDIRPQVRSAATGQRSSRKVPSATEVELASAVLTKLEDCLATLDVLTWTLPAAHLSQAVDSVRQELTLLRIESAGRADVLPG